MASTVMIFEKELEYDFLSGWIRYTRIKKNLSQEALAHGICSTSHLSYFENGKKHLRPEIIEALLKKLNINLTDNLPNIGLIRQKLNIMKNDIESYNFDGAKEIHTELSKLENIINNSPYNIEFKIYDLMYKTFVENLPYNKLKDDMDILDKILNSLSYDLKFLYLLISGIILSKQHKSKEAIERQLQALMLKDTSWINFCLGQSLCFNSNPAKGSYYLEKALDIYEKSGMYLNAVWCHNYLGICFSYLKIYENAEKHFNAAFMSAKHFDMENLYFQLYTNLSDLYFYKGNYEKSIKYSKLAMETTYDSILPAYNYILACMKLNKIDDCNEIFDIYLNEKFESSMYYNALYFAYLCIHKFNDEFFYTEVKNKILPYYEERKISDLCRDIKLKLIEYLESRRKYKEANKLYKQLL